ncbi:MAG: thymidine phosphorylase [Thermoanaerobaculia bacterium]
MTDFSPYEVLNRKRRGEQLPDSDIQFFVSRYAAGAIPDYQMASLLMAIAIQGMSSKETATLTRAMIASGEQWELHKKYDFIADKHSTGGVGDKISIPLSPLVAACGVKIAMLSGRGLGHTGGTLDKLDAIPGFNARLSREELEQCLDEVGCAIATSTDRIAPADRKMYALRDVTGTVESLALITASIMSKKLAMGASALLLDVKTGSGAFMREYDASRALALSLVGAAKGAATSVEAMITDMDAPLGVAAGNANEVAESFEILSGGGPADSAALTRAQAARILVMSGQFTPETANAKIEEVLSSGAALEHARKWIAAQGGDPEIVDHPERLAQPKKVIEIRAPRDGFVAKIDTYAAGMFGVDLGAGRKQQNDEIDPAAGIMFDRKPGDAVRTGEPIARLLIGREGRDEHELRTRFLSFVQITDAPPAKRPLIHETIRSR